MPWREYFNDAMDLDGLKFSQQAMDCLLIITNITLTDN